MDYYNRSDSVGIHVSILLLWDRNAQWIGLCFFVDWECFLVDSVLAGWIRVGVGGLMILLKQVRGLRETCFHPAKVLRTE